jgi:integrase
MVRERAPQGYNQGNIRKHGNQWQAVISYYDEFGKRTQKTKLLGIECDPEPEGSRGIKSSESGKGAAKAKAALKEWRDQLIAEEEERKAQASKPKHAKAADLTVYEYISKFIDQRAATGIVEQSTISDYRTTLRTCISFGAPAGIRDIPLRDLEPEHVRAWEALLVSPKPEGGGYSNNTVGKAHRLLKQVLKQAISDGVIERDPMRGIKPPKRERNRPNALDTTTAPKMLAYLNSMPRDTYVTIAARIAMLTGMRRGEVCGLKWSDVDLATGTAWVRRSVGEGEGGSYLKEPKTGKERDVTLPESLVSKLTEWRETQRAEYAAIGITNLAECYVIGTPKGYASPAMLSKLWHEIAKQSGIKGTEGRVPTFHDLRHTYATVAIASGIDVKTVSSMLGHSNAAMTLNIYASADPEAKRDAASKVDRALTKDTESGFRVYEKTGTED